jgi:hypothetical protein
MDNVERPIVDYKIMPVSVIDIEAQKKRQAEDHAATSSRANYSPFPKEVADLCYQYFLRDATHVVDPFAGWGERGSKAREWNTPYTGYDISEDAITTAQRDHGVDNVQGDIRSADLPPFDGMLTCPPYWNLEKYANEKGADRIKTWEGFIVELSDILGYVYREAKPGSVFCIQVGDWRKNHVYYDLDRRVGNIYAELGASVVDKVVISRKKVSKIKIMLPQAKRLGYTVRVHENLSVFKKPLLELG